MVNLFTAGDLFATIQHVLQWGLSVRLYIFLGIELHFTGLMQEGGRHPRDKANPRITQAEPMD